MRYTITGDNLQFVNIQLDDGEKIDSTAGAMKYMSGNVTMEAKLKGGFVKGLKRSIMGESMFLVEYAAHGGSGIVGFGGSVPGKIMDLDISKGTWLVQKTGYLCSEQTVDLNMAFQKKISGALFGGEGFILEKLSGSGTAFVAACGDFNVIDLKPGEVYKVSTANAVAWEESVGFDIASAGGLKTALFGGEGLFVTTLTGPGKIVLQSMSLKEMAFSLIPFIPSSG